jgi:hypothetical protein
MGCQDRSRKKQGTCFAKGEGKGGGNLQSQRSMVKMMNGGFPRVAKFVAIFAVKVVRMFFNFRASRMS